MPKETEALDTRSEDVDLTTLGDAITGVAERPKSLDPKDLTGTEDIGANDIRLPRLSIAQGLSPQMTPGDGQFIENLKMFDFFNDLTKEVYGKGPITFVPLRRNVHRIEFTPRSEGGGIVDVNVPPNDPRLAWTKSSPDAAKADVPPRATTFVEFVILMLRSGKAPEPIVFSIKGTNKFNRRASDQLTTFIKLRNAPIYSGLYTVLSGSEKNDKGTFGVPLVKNDGFIPKDTPAGAALFTYAKGFHESLKGKDIIVKREPGDEDFDTAAMDAQPTTEM